eukprot:10776833-Prorocentrum_lima.AAC.1
MMKMRLDGFVHASPSLEHVAGLPTWFCAHMVLCMLPPIRGFLVLCMLRPLPGFAHASASLEDV